MINLFLGAKRQTLCLYDKDSKKVKSTLTLCSFLLKSVAAYSVFSFFFKDKMLII